MYVCVYKCIGLKLVVSDRSIGATEVAAVGKLTM